MGINELDLLVKEAKDLKEAQKTSTETVEQALFVAFDYVEDHQPSQPKFTYKPQKSLSIESEPELQEEKQKVSYLDNNLS